jgi:hypothetical protein
MVDRLQVAEARDDEAGRAQEARAQARVRAAVAGMEHGTAVRALGAMGVDPKQLAAAAQAPPSR